jgi:glucose/arabinose dehydrogenase
MRKVTSLFLVTAGLLGFGCGDDTATGGSAPGGGNTGGENTGAGSTGGNDTGGSGGEGAGTSGGNNPGGGGPGGMGPGFSCDDPTGEPPALALTEVADLSQVIQIKSPPGAPDKLFLVRQNGTIRIYENDALVETPFIDVSDLIQAGGEEGLLGLAFHPDYAANGRFFLHYSADGGGASTVQEFAVSADPNVADPAPVQLVIQHPTAQGNHNGGAVEFGNDGFLYISMGDGGAQGDPGCDAQNPANLLGKIMRIDVDGTANADGYPAAAGNPGGNKFYHIGFRNPWRMSFDSCTGDLYIGDVGQGEYEEIDVITQAAGAGNCGWPIREGMHDYGGYDGSCVNEPAAPLEPIAEYNHGGGKCSVTGGYVYRGSEMPGLRGWYFYSDYCTGETWMVRASDGVVVDAVQDAGITPGNVSAFGQDGNGEVYVSDIGGTVYKITAE